MYLRLKFVHRQDRITLCYWQIFKVHYILPLNYILGILKNVIAFGYPPMICSPLLTKQYTVRGQGIITCNRDRWHGVCGVWGRSNLPQNVQQSFLNQSSDPHPPPPIKNSWIRLWIIISRDKTIVSQAVL